MFSKKFFLRQQQVIRNPFLTNEELWSKVEVFEILNIMWIYYFSVLSTVYCILKVYLCLKGSENRLKNESKLLIKTYWQLLWYSRSKLVKFICIRLPIGTWIVYVQSKLFAYLSGWSGEVNCPDDSVNKPPHPWSKMKYIMLWLDNHNHHFLWKVSSLAVAVYMGRCTVYSAQSPMSAALFVAESTGCKFSSGTPIFPTFLWICLDFIWLLHIIRKVHPYATKWATIRFEE